MSLRRLLVLAGVVFIVAGLIAGVYVWRAHQAQAVRVGESVSLHGGKVTFRAPAGWSRKDCQSGDTVNCVTLLAPGGDPGNADSAVTDPGDTILVVASTPDPRAPEGDPSLLPLDPIMSPPPGMTYFIRDGVRFVRTHMEARTTFPPGPATTIVMGVLPNKDKVALSCAEKTKPSLVRAGCDIVIDSLHVSP